MTVVAIETEADKVAKHKQAIAQALAAVVEACETARRDGFFVEFGVPLDQYGRYCMTGPTLLKRF